MDLISAWKFVMLLSHEDLIITTQLFVVQLIDWLSDPILFSLISCFVIFLLYYLSPFVFPLFVPLLNYELNGLWHLIPVPILKMNSNKPSRNNFHFILKLSALEKDDHPSPSGIMFPLFWLKGAQSHSMIVKLKISKISKGHHMNCYQLMNVNLREHICTYTHRSKFWGVLAWMIRSLCIPKKTVKWLKKTVGPGTTVGCCQKQQED